ncbi:hypothetical protein FE257_010883 [Aspergillus nanangensis]|uniref:DNA repair protein Rad26 n=1 Tax=Aspergillus nanangensis TaxID=2582783 RepID=A0AAD4CW08_ASPNN|nr:hypothetical protein FE257_010883 [Aspergillus nanangensis]
MEITDDDFFSDDGFDDLPPGTWLQLEQDAFRTTQVQPSAHQTPSVNLIPPSRDFGPSVSRRYQAGFVEPPVPANATLKPPALLHTGLTNDYDSLDVGELDAEVLNDDTISTIALEQNVSFSGLVDVPQDGPVTGGESRPVEHALPEPMEVEGDVSHYDDIQMMQGHPKEQAAWDGEQYQHIMQDLASAKSMAETKAGEIAIIRSNQAKLIENYDRQLAALRKAMTDEVFRHKEEVEAARAEGKMLATENAFLKQDLAEESIRNNTMQKKARLEEKPAPVTPKKSRALPFRDGFDDDEIVAVSPSKTARSKRVASVVPGKRKRRASQDSPTPLQLSPQADRMATDPGVADLSDDVMVDAMANNAPEKSPKKIENNSLLLMKRILNHRTFPNEEPDIEVMARMAFPSEPRRMLSTILLEEMAKLEVGGYPVEYVQVVVSLWSRALKETFYQPIPIFMSVTRYILLLDTALSDFIDHLVPVLQDSGDVNGVPRFKHSPVSTRRGFGQIRQTPQSELSPLVDSTDALGILYQLACGCLHLPRDLDNFWRHMRYDFILMMLNGAQRLRDIVLTLGLLMTSVRAHSFGSIHDTEQDQAANENYIVERVANLLSETPQVDEGEAFPTRFEISSMRLEALSLLATIAFNPSAPTSTHGSGVIASHPTALARLVRAMHDELDALYSSPPEKDLHTALVNGLMRLVYTVTQRHKGQIDLQSKLCRVPGGEQKFLVVFTRLAFSEGLVLEAGIEDETVEMAHEMLDDAVNPQEAEALQEAFSGSSSKREE